jgi:DNA helicase-2/ATP-dependent DNA helicase PcrA
LRAVLVQYEETSAGEPDLAQFLHDVALVSDVDELESDEGAVTLITLHAAKGLEFPVVFMAGMEEGVLPHIRSFDDPRAMEEERRLAYVGITRAADLLYLTRAYRRFGNGTTHMNPASRFLADIPRDLARPWGASGRSRSYVETALAEPSESALEPAAEAALQPGTRVLHPRFGPGMVISASKNGGDVEYQVAFDDDAHGTKRLLQTYARLVPA